MATGCVIWLMYAADQSLGPRLAMAHPFKRLRLWIRNNPEDSTPVMIAGAIILMAAMALAYSFLF
jgi:hypothetical protein